MNQPSKQLTAIRQRQAKAQILVAQQMAATPSLNYTAAFSRVQDAYPELFTEGADAMGEPKALGLAKKMGVENIRSGGPILPARISAPGAKLANERSFPSAKLAGERQRRARAQILVSQVMAASPGLEYTAAFSHVQAAHPELFSA